MAREANGMSDVMFGRRYTNASNGAETMRMWQTGLLAGAMVVVTGCSMFGSTEIKKPEVPKVDPYVPECMATKEAVAKTGDLIRMAPAPAEQGALTAWPLMVKGFAVPLPSGTYRGLRFALNEGRLTVFYLGEKTRVMVDSAAMSALLAELPADETSKVYGDVSDWSKYTEGLLSAAPTAYDYNYLGFKHGLKGADCEKKGRGHNTVLFASYPIAMAFAAGKQASAVFMPVPPPAPAEGEEALPPLQGMILQGKTVNPATNESYESWSTLLRSPGQADGILAEFTVLAEGSPAPAAAFATGYAFAGAEKAPKWLPALEVAIATPDKKNIAALKKALGSDKKVDKETLASIEQVVQQLK
jgi:hypothetical protein